MDATTIVLSIIGGGSFLTFLQFIISRYDGRKDKKDEVLQEVRSVRKDVADFKAETEDRFDSMNRKIDDGQAIQARARILRFSDEVQTGRKFSRSAWNQTFQDISDYEGHCGKYEDFPNSQADAAIKNVKTVHMELLARERDGEEVFL